MSDDSSDSSSPSASGAARAQSPGHTEANGGLIGWVRRKLGGRNGADALRETIEELIEQEHGDDSPETDELIMFRNVLRLRHLAARDVMVPRADIAAVAIDTSLADLVAQMSGTAHSRMPVYRNNLDDVIGMIHIKDMLDCWGSSEPFRISNLVRRVLFVAPSMPILELLLQMRASRIHMALVVDEFGGIDGLITIEDLVEEIVGEIEDEHDDLCAPRMDELRRGVIRADARVTVESFEDRFGKILTDDEREDVDTLGGLVFHLAGRVPARGELIRHSTGLEFEVVDADPRRIRILRVRNLPAPLAKPSPGSEGKAGSSP